MVATINNFGGFYRTELYVHEAKIHGAIIEAPCINQSFNEAIINGKTIYLGFMFLHALESKTVKKFIGERQKKGHFKSLDDFIDRVPISIEQISILIKINAFRFTKANKRELLWEAHLKISKVSYEEHIVTLFRTEKINYITPKLPSTHLENAFDAIELLGFPLCNPFELLESKTTFNVKAEDLPKHINKTVSIEGYLIATKNTATSTGRMMHFGTFLDYNGHFIDTVHFPPIASKFPFRGRGIYKITGKVLEEFDCINIEVLMMEKLPVIQDPRYSDPSPKFLSQRKNNPLKVI
jgi:DNA polymerase-3 subunit alpha